MIYFLCNDQTLNIICTRSSWMNQDVTESAVECKIICGLIRIVKPFHMTQKEKNVFQSQVNAHIFATYYTVLCILHYTDNYQVQKISQKMMCNVTIYTKGQWKFWNRTQHLEVHYSTHLSLAAFKTHEVCGSVHGKVSWNTRINFYPLSANQTVITFWLKQYKTK